MPESSSRKKPNYVPPPDKRKAIKIGSPRWIAPLMVTLFVVGLLWIVTWYIAPDAPYIGPLGAWNVVIGFGLIAVGFIVATKWK